MHQCCLRNRWPIAAPLYKTVIITGGRALPLLVRQRGSIHCDILLSRDLLCDPIRDYLIMAQHNYGLVWEIWANVSKNVYEREKVCFFGQNIWWTTNVQTLHVDSDFRTMNLTNSISCHRFTKCYLMMLWQIDNRISLFIRNKT